MDNSCPLRSVYPFGGKLNDMIRIFDRKGSAICHSFTGGGSHTVEPPPNRTQSARDRCCQCR